MTEQGATTGFVHLHVHTQYSLLEGAIHVDSLIEKVAELGMSAVAITDTNNMFGAIDFYNQARKAKIKPIIGCEVYYAADGASFGAKAATTIGGVTNLGPRFHHLVLLCKSHQGYQNLCQLLSKAYRELQNQSQQKGALGKAVVTRELLDRYGDGLIVLSGCIRGEIPYKLLTGDEAGARDVLLWFKKRFGPDFFLELQDTGLPEQDQANEALFLLGQKHGVPCVATADAHYLEPKDAEAHEVLLCIEVGKNLDYDRPKSLVPPEYYLKPPALMRERFARFEGACDATLEIAARCDAGFRFTDEKGRTIYRLPNYRPEGVTDPNFDLIAYFREQSRKGLEARFEELAFHEKKAKPEWPELKETYLKRLEDELVMIERTGFSGYFLIVADFINWAKNNDIPVGPGRGSGAGSIVAYALRITNIDPIEFNLLFERFINPERISMPDFDVDFCQDRRGEVIEYVGRKYGAENVSQIITFGKLQAKAVMKDVGRVLGFTFAESDQLTKLVPEELHITISKAIEQEPRLREKIEQEPRTAKAIEYALALEGLYRNAGVHAAGVIITEEPIVSYSPLYAGKDGVVVTQFDKDSAETIGLVKFDFLGLKTLTVIDHAVKLIRKTAEPGTPETEFSIELINYKDLAVFELISSGDTDGVFQIESSGMKDLCSRLQPNSIEDLTAICALYRPGPLGSGMVDDFIDRKHGRKPINYDVPQLENILRDTYGVIVYQEQVMQMARDLAGYSLGQADLLRRAMGKKKAEEMAKHRAIFSKGAVERGIDEAKATALFDLMEKFAEYGFNKSHSAAYAVVSYQTAYLKTHFPAEFMAALMTTEMDNTDKITRYIGDARAHGIPVLSPDVNHSQKRFSVERGANNVKCIRFGLEAIKGVGSIAVDSILQARTESPFKNAMDFCRRVSTRKANKKVIESLTLAGAFDPIAEVNRASLFASIETLVEFAGDEQEERELGQHSLFDAFASEEVNLVTHSADSVFKREEEWPEARKLAMEKQIVGFYVSGHPMDKWQNICEDWLGWSTERVRTAEPPKEARSAPSGANGSQGQGGGWRRPQRPEIKIAGLIGEIKEIVNKKGQRMAFAQLEDLKGKVELTFFSDAFTASQEMLKQSATEAEPVVVTGELEVRDDGGKILVRSLEWVSEAHRTRVQQVIVKLRPSAVSPDQLRELKKYFLQNRGKCPVRIDFVDSDFRTSLRLPKTVRISANPQLVQAVNRIFGADVVQLQ